MRLKINLTSASPAKIVVIILCLAVLLTTSSLLVKRERIETGRQGWIRPSLLHIGAITGSSSITAGAMDHLCTEFFCDSNTVGECSLMNSAPVTILRGWPIPISERYTEYCDAMFWAWRPLAAIVDVVFFSILLGILWAWNVRRLSLRQVVKRLRFGNTVRQRIIVSMLLGLTIAAAVSFWRDASWPIASYLPRQNTAMTAGAIEIKDGTDIDLFRGICQAADLSPKFYYGGWPIAHYYHDYCIDEWPNVYPLAFMANVIIYSFAVFYLLTINRWLLLRKHPQ